MGNNLPPANTDATAQRALDLLDQMYEYYTREPKAPRVARARMPRVVTELDSRTAA